MSHEPYARIGLPHVGFEVQRDTRQTDVRYGLLALGGAGWFGRRCSEQKPWPGGDQYEERQLEQSNDEGARDASPLRTFRVIRIRTLHCGKASSEDVHGV